MTLILFLCQLHMQNLFFFFVNTFIFYLQYVNFGQVQINNQLKLKEKMFM